MAVRPFDPPCYITLGILIPSLKNASPAAKKFIAYARRMIADTDKAMEPDGILL